MLLFHEKSEGLFFSNLRFRRKKRAKVLLFFKMTKFFLRKVYFFFYTPKNTVSNSM